ncbi:hypothetical protein GCM10023169_32660 [Georgenia halophila]|uniref:DUF3995 domain-containing protein n=1 Tax=Georgenia halophila TaxID=620889 RepID=A0ABP8LK38_9MICO
MSSSAAMTRPTTERVAVRSRWVVLARAVAAGWSLVYLVLGIGWLAGARGNPADPAVDQAAVLNLLGMLGPTAGAATLTVLAAAGVVLTVFISRRHRSARTDRIVGTVAVALGLVLAVAIPDSRVLQSLGYAPMVLVLAVTGQLPEGAEVMNWGMANLLILTAAGVAWAGVGAARLTAAYRSTGRPGWTRPESVARWGNWVTWIAMAVPLGYAVTRYAWALGIPLGLTQETFEDVRQIAGIGAVLATGGVLGAFLTWGLTRPWGAVFPRWAPGVGGRRVPVALAVVPAGAVAAAVTSAGLMFVRVAIDGRLADFFPVGMDDVAGWLPEMFWPLWGVALGAATLAYVLRRIDEDTDQRPGRTSPLS